MTNKVAPSAFRLGKTFLWRTNTIGATGLASSSRVQLSAATILNGVPRVLKHLLKRKRLFTVRTVIRHNLKTNCVGITCLYMPRVKTRPQPDSFGRFARYVLYKRLHWGSRMMLETGKHYIDERRLKIYRFITPRERMINK